MAFKFCFKDNLDTKKKKIFSKNVFNLLIIS